jgi:hypothetical protein
MDLALAEGCDLAELARQSKIQLGAATTSNPRPTVSEVGRSKLEFASEAGPSLYCLVEAPENPEPPITAAPASTPKKNQRETQPQKTNTVTPTKITKTPATTTPLKTPLKIPLKTLAAKTPTKQTQPQPQTLTRQTRAATPRPRVVVEVLEDDTPQQEDTLQEDALQEDDTQDTLQEDTLQEDTLPPISPPPPAKKKIPASELRMRRMEEELRVLREQVRGPTLTDVASTTRLERMPAPPPVQTQESALTALIHVVKDQMDQMKEQSAWNRESMALMIEQRQINQALLAAMLGGRVHKYFS